MTPEDKKRDRYYTRKYGITLVEYKVMLEAQKGLCLICLNPPATLALAVDHCHKWKYVQISTVKMPDGIWVSEATYLNKQWRTEFRKKNEAIQKMRSLHKRASVRALLCTHCNPGLRHYADNPDRLQRAVDYLRKHQEGYSWLTPQQ